MWIKVNEVLGRENLINLDKVERITSDGSTGSMFWFGKDDADSMHIVESYEEVELMIHFSEKVKGVMDREQLHNFMNQPADMVF
ncbi:hypothetical protein [Planomicrobium okeanokoites]|uniref:Uncharacterized protein n=1 Tax=Planomicrobium okeanokoites TaxID=244 RepID=A0ABV7KT42_PLAOK|nr:hypothetical protein [Planomicrobium okeanokoites]TAA67445.1 hypothetical protein D2910_13725 [Planomicrobium okeanokoites]